MTPKPSAQTRANPAAERHESAARQKIRRPKAGLDSRQGQKTVRQPHAGNDQKAGQQGTDEGAGRVERVKASDPAADSMRRNDRAHRHGKGHPHEQSRNTQHERRLRQDVPDRGGPAELLRRQIEGHGKERPPGAPVKHADRAGNRNAEEAEDQAVETRGSRGAVYQEPAQRAARGKAREKDREHRRERVSRVLQVLEGEDQPARPDDLGRHGDGARDERPQENERSGRLRMEVRRGRRFRSFRLTGRSLSRPAPFQSGARARTRPARRRCSRGPPRNWCAGRRRRRAGESPTGRLPRRPRRC